MNGYNRNQTRFVRTRPTDPRENRRTNPISPRRFSIYLMYTLPLMALGYRLFWSEDFIYRMPPAASVTPNTQTAMDTKLTRAVPAPLKPTSSPTFLPTYVTTIQDTTSGTKEGHVRKKAKESESEEEGSEEEESAEGSEEGSEEEA